MTELLLRIAYTANILILIPVVWSLATGPAARIFERDVPDVPSMRILIASLWGAILACSIVGLAWPRAMSAILLLQILYKGSWLLWFVLPAWRARRAVPWGPAITFVPIVLIWPFIFALAWTSA